MSLILSKPFFDSFGAYALDATDRDNGWCRVLSLQLVPGAAADADCLAKVCHSDEGVHILRSFYSQVRDIIGVRRLLYNGQPHPLGSA